MASESNSAPERGVRYRTGHFTTLYSRVGPAVDGPCTICADRFPVPLRHACCRQVSFDARVAVLVATFLDCQQPVPALLERGGSGANFQKDEMIGVVMLFKSCCQCSFPHSRRNLALNAQPAQCKLAFAEAMHQLDPRDRDGR